MAISMVDSKQGKREFTSDVLEKLEAEARRAEQHLISHWSKVHKSILAELIQPHTDCLQRLHELSQKDFTFSQFCLEVEGLLQQVVSLLNEKYAYVSEEETAAAFWQEWRSQFEQVSQQLPKSQTLYLPQKYWTISPEDPINVKLWKKARRSQIVATENFLRAINVIRKLARKEPISPRRPRRQIDVRQFFSYYYEVDIARRLLQIWQRLLRLYANQLHDLHRTSESLIEELLFVEQLPEIQSSEVHKQIKQVVSRVQGMLPKQETFFDEITRFEGELKKDREDHLRQLNERLQYRWELAGTFVLTNSRYGEKRIAERQEDLEKDFEENRQAWFKHFQGEASDWEKDLELSVLQVETTRVCIETIDSLNAKIHEQVLPAFDQPEQIIKQALKEFESFDGQDEAELRSRILTENRSTFRKLRRDVLPTTLDTMAHAQIVKAVENYLSRLRHAIEKLPESHSIFRHEDRENLEPNSRISAIPLKDLVLDEIFYELEKSYLPFLDETQSKIDQIVRDISELDEIVEFNLDAALELLEQETQSVLHQAQNIVIEGLQRTQNQLTEILADTNELLDRCLKRLLASTVEFESGIQALADNEKIVALQFRVAKAKTQEEMRDYRKRALQTIKEAFPTFIKIGTETVRRVKSGYVRVRKLTGLAPVPPDVEQKLTQYLTETRRQLDALPYVYQRLFRFDALADERFFAGRNKELDFMRERFDAWKNGDYAITALIGEKGSGRTTLLNFAEKQIYKTFPVIQLDILQTTSTEHDLLDLLKEVFSKDEISSLDEMEQAILEQDAKVVCVVENLHKLFLRTVEGFDAMERFLLLITNTYRQIYWVITCGLYGWNYLDKVIDLSKFFRNVIFMQELDSENIESLILKRHRVSGYQLLFETPESVAKSRRFAKLPTEESRQAYLQNMFFEHLNRHSIGNITVAMLFWLRAIKEIQKERFVISPVIDFDPSFLRRLPTEELFTFAALLQHDSLTPEEHAKVFNQGTQKSLLLLNRMKNRGILAHTSRGYQIHYLLYRPIVRALKISNILH